MLRFWELLAEGASAGQQLLTVLRSIHEVLPPEPMGDVAAALAADIERGYRLSEAMRSHPSVFSKAHVYFVEGGECVGRVDRLLLLIVELTRECPTCGALQFPPRNTHTPPGSRR